MKTKPKWMPARTENGWEPACWSDEFGFYMIEPGFAKPTKEECQKMIDDNEAEAAQCETENRNYQSQYAHACGYQD